MKTCCRCKSELLLSSFSKCRSNKDGLARRCKDCDNAVYEANKAKKLAYMKQYRKDNPNAQKEWRRKNWDRYHELQQKFVEKNPEYHSTYYKVNADRYKSHAHTRRARMYRNGVYEVPTRIISRLKSSECIYCGSKSNITLDHVIPISRGGCHSVGNLVPACKSCNSSKNDRTIMEWRLAVPRP